MKTIPSLNSYSFLFLPCLLLFVVSAHASTNVFFTRFERSEGYNASYELVGQNGWACDTQSYGGNGLITNFAGTQAAYVGGFPLDPLTDIISVWKPLDFRPLQSGLPVVEFSALVGIIDSTTTNRDDFLWTAYNSEGNPLLSIDFYNEGLGIYYGLGTNDLVYTGVDFTNYVDGAPYDLRIKMDFTHNRWSATLSGILLVTNQLIATGREVLDLWDMDAVWWPLNPNRPGDNLMVFDNYKITADALPAVRLSGLGRDSNGQFLLRLTGPSGSRYAVEGSTNLLQWTSLKTNIVTDGYFDFIDSGASSLSRRFYRAREVY